MVIAGVMLLYVGVVEKMVATRLLESRSRIASMSCMADERPVLTCRCRTCGQYSSKLVLVLTARLK